MGKLWHPPPGLAERIRSSLELYPCNLLFVHRDAERAPYALRKREILEAAREAAGQLSVTPPVVCVVPVRMLEAWLLWDESAIRRAAGNPRGSESLGLPELGDLERLPGPKTLLHDALRQASGLSSRRRRRIRVAAWVHRIPEYIDDFSPLRALPAFRALETEVGSVIAKMGWNRLAT